MHIHYETESLHCKIKKTYSSGNRKPSLQNKKYVNYKVVSIFTVKWKTYSWQNGTHINYNMEYT